MIAPDNALDVDIGADAAGNYVVAWSEEGSSGRQVYFQRFNRQSVPIGPVTFVDTITPLQELNFFWGVHPAVEVAPDGRFAIVTEKREQGNTAQAPFVYLFNSNGSPIAEPFPVPTPDGRVRVAVRASVSLDHQQNLTIGYTDLDEFYSTIGGGVQRFNFQGESVGDEISLSLTSSEFLTALAESSDGGIATFRFDFSSGAKAHWYAADGLPLGSPIVLPFNTLSLDVSPMPNGEVLAAAANANGEVLVIRVGPDGISMDEPLHLSSVSDPYYTASYPSVAVNASGDFLVMVRQQAPTPERYLTVGWAIARFNSYNQPLGSVIRLGDLSRKQVLSAIVWQPGGDFVAAWNAFQPSDTSHNHPAILTQRYLALIPGDANHDGVVATADYAIWAAQFGQKGDDLGGDANEDGSVGLEDYALWAANFGRFRSTALPGDANDDQVVGAADYSIWSAQVGQSGVGLAGDFNHDGHVGPADYAIWAANFGKIADTDGPYAHMGNPRLVDHSLGSISVLFNEPVVGAALDPAAYQLIETTGSQPGRTIPVTEILPDGNNHVVVRLGEVLDAGDYQLKLSPQIVDRLGNALVEPRQLAFSITASTPSPQFVDLRPVDGANLPGNAHTVRLDFSTVMDPATINPTSVSLLSLAGTGTAISPLSFAWSDDDKSVTITYPQLAAGDYRVRVRLDFVSDTAGTPVGVGDRVSTFHVQPHTIQWVSATGGYWDDAANWSGGHVPGPNDQVLIILPDDQPVIFRSGNATVASLGSTGPVVLEGGVLDVNGTVQVDAGLALSGGTLRHAVVEQSLAGKPVSVVVGTLDGVTLNTDVDVTSADGHLTLVGQVTINGVLRIGSADGLSSAELEVVSDGTAPQLLLGAGQIRLGPTSNNAIVIHNPGAGDAGTLTIGPQLKLVGRAGLVRFADDSPLATLVNQGHIVADDAGPGLLILPAASPGTLKNSGLLRAEGGGQLVASKLKGSAGRVEVEGAGSLVEINGAAWTNDQSFAVAPGGTLRLRGGWSSSGAIAVDHGTLDLGGAVTTANLDVSQFRNIGGQVVVTGELFNAGTVLMLDDETGSWQLAGGKVKGGTVRGLGGARLAISQATLDQVTLDIDVDITAAAASQLTVLHGLVLNKTMQIGAADGSTVGKVVLGDGAAAPQLLSGTGRLIFGSATGNALWIYSSGVGDLGTLTLDQGIQVSGRAGQLGAAPETPTARLRNLGSIVAGPGGTGLSLGAPDSGSGWVDNLGLMGASDGGKLSVYGLTGNLGMTTLSDSGSQLVLDGDAWVNDQGLSVPAGTSLSVSGAWSSQAAIHVTGGTLNLAGSLTTADLNLSQFFNSGGIVNLTATLDNTDATLRLDGQTGAWNAQGAAILHGRVEAVDGQSLTIMSGPYLFDSVTLEGTFTFAADAAITIHGGLTLDSATINVFGSTHGDVTSLLFENGSQSLAGTGTIEMMASYWEYLKIYSQGANSSLTIDAGITIRGTGTVGDGAPLTVLGTVMAAGDQGGILMLPSSLINSGTLECLDRANLSILPTTTFTNHGTIHAAGRRAQIRGVWENLGTILLENSCDLWFTGTFSRAGIGHFVRTGGFVNLSGTIDNGGQDFYLDETTGDWRLAKVTFNGGTLSSSPGTKFTTSNNITLNGVVLACNLVVSSGNAATITGGFMLEETYLTVNGTANVTGLTDRVDGSGTIVVGASGTLSLNATSPSLTLGPNISLQGGGTVKANVPLRVEGDVLATTSGAIQASTVTIAGTLQTTGSAQFTVTGNWLNQGMIHCDDTSTLQLNGSVGVNQGTLTAAGASHVTLLGSWSNSGDLVMSGDSVFNLGGYFDTASMTNLHRSGGQIVLMGRLDNTGTTLTFGPSLGQWSFAGVAEILGGTIDGAPGYTLLVGPGQLLLNGVTLACDVRTTVGAALHVTNGLTLQDAVIALGPDDNAVGFPQMTFVGSNQSVAGTGVISLPVNNLGYAGIIDVLPASPTQVIIGPGILIRGAGRVGSFQQPLIIQGAVLADVPGRTLAIWATTLTNQGELKALGGATLDLRKVTTLVNTGTIFADPTSQVLLPS